MAGDVAGIGTTLTATPRKVMLGYERYLPGGGIIDAGLSADPTNSADVRCLQEGMLMGLITATKKWRPAVIGVSTANYTSGATSLTVAAAVATEVARLIADAGASITLYVVGAPTAAGTVVAISTTCSVASGTTLTITDLAANVVAGSYVCPGDGAATIKGILQTPVGTGIKVTDDEGNSTTDKALDKLCIGGRIDVSQIVNWPAATLTTLIAWNKAALTVVGATFDYDDAHYG